MKYKELFDIYKLLWFLYVEFCSFRAYNHYIQMFHLITLTLILFSIHRAWIISLVFLSWLSKMKSQCFGYWMFYCLKEYQVRNVKLYLVQSVIDSNNDRIQGSCRSWINPGKPWNFVLIFSLSLRGKSWQGFFSWSLKVYLSLHIMLNMQCFKNYQVMTQKNGPIEKHEFSDYFWNYQPLKILNKSENVMEFSYTSKE